MDSEYFVEVKIVFVNKVLTVSSMIMWSDWTWLSTGATHTTVRVEDSRPPGCRRQGGSRRPAPGARRGSGGRRWRGPRRRRGAGTGCVWRAPGPAGAGAGALQETCCRRDSPHPTEPPLLHIVRIIIIAIVISASHQPPHYQPSPPA